MATIGQDVRGVPDHVPAELVWSENFEKFATAEPDPFRRMGKLHEGPDILWVETFATGMGSDRSGWLVTRHALIREVLSDTDRFVSGGGENLLGAIGLDWPLIP